MFFKLSVALILFFLIEIFCGIIFHIQLFHSYETVLYVIFYKYELSDLIFVLGTYLNSFI